MYLNHFESSHAARLSQLMHTLGNVYGVKIKIDLNAPKAETNLLSLQESWSKKRDLIVAESSFNSYQQNPQYIKTMLILEAIGLMLTEIAPKRSRKRKMAESTDEKLSVMDAEMEHGDVEPGMDNVLETGKTDQDGDGDSDFADVMISRMVAGGMPKGAAIAATKDKKYNKESMVAEDDTMVDPQAQAEKGTVGQSHHYEYQASMARSELYRNARYAMSMMKQIDPSQEIQPWIAGSLTKAANYLDKIFHYLDYYTKFEPQNLPENMDGEMELGETSGSIARECLLMIMEYSTKLFDMISPGDKLEGWVAMKLTTASECISSCKHYMDYLQFENNALDDHFDEGRRAMRKGMKESRMLAEDEDLAKAQTIIYAKEMVGKLQDMAEDVAKLGVDDLMPLVDRIREQFGSEAADGFNDVAKDKLDALLNNVRDTKESIDTATNAVQSGGVPGQSSDIETADTAGQPATDARVDSDIEKDMSSEPTGDEGGDETSSEPLGRAKKDELTEGKKKLSPAFLKNIKGKGDKKEVEEAAVEEKWDTKMKTAKKDVGKKPVVTWERNPPKPQEKLKKPEMFQIDPKNLEENAPPGEKAERFINDNKAKFIKQYGKDKGMNVLYATAWKQFGPKSESFERAASVMETCKALMQNLEAQMSKHRKQFSKMLAEGAVSDPLSLGYGLEGNLIMLKMQSVTKKIAEAKSVMQHEMQQGIENMISSIMSSRKVTALKEAKLSTPYGVVYTAKNGRRVSKMFESRDTRAYWLELHGSSLENPSMIEPENFDAAIAKTSKE